MAFVALWALLAAARVSAELQHYWPYARGHIGKYMLTNETLPKGLKDSFAWQWTFPKGKHTTVVRGNPLFDHEKNIIIVTEGGLFKLSPEGKQLWVYRTETAMMNVVPSIWDQHVYGVDKAANVYAVRLDSGKETWRRKPSYGVGSDTAYVEAHDGILLFSVDENFKYGGGNNRVLALNATDGEHLWEHKLDLPTWNFTPLFPGDGTFILMDVSGGVTRLRHSDGKLIWHSPPPKAYLGSFTDGGVGLGPEGVSYACSNNENTNRGSLRARRHSDGQLLWDKALPTGCTSWPVIAPGGTWGVLPVGGFVSVPLIMNLPQWMPLAFKLISHVISLAMGARFRLLIPQIPLTATYLIAFDTATGATRWEHRLPDWERLAAKGDEEGVISRGNNICLPTTWSAPSLSGDGTAYAGHVSGILYAVKDKNGNGIIEPTEVESFDMGDAPLPNNAAWAPGMMAMQSCDGVFVFKS